MLHVYNPFAFFLLLLIPLLIAIGLRTYDRASGLRRGVMIAARSLVALALVADLLTLQVWWTDTKQDLCVYYLVDLSTSMQPHRREAARAVRESLEARDSRTWAGVIAFDARPRVLVPAGPTPDVRLIAEAIEGQDPGLARSAAAEEQETNLAAAIRLALSSFPGDRARRICLVSDANETEGNAVQQAWLAGQAGVDIVALDLQLRAKPDVAVDRISLPETVHLNQAFPVTVSLTSSFPAGGPDTDSRAALRLYRNHVLVSSRDVELRPGGQTAEFRQRLDRGGRFVYEARLTTERPQNPENDRVVAYLELRDVPRLLIVADEAEEQRHLRAAFEGARVHLDVRPARGLPQTMLDLQDFAAVLIGNLPASAMSSNQMKLLHDYVREFGGSVVMAGGDQALAAGGYAGTLVEDLLPALCSFGEKETPTSALVMVADTSVSVRIHPEDFQGEKTAFTSQLYGQAVQVLSDRDRLGLIGMASELTSARWFLTLQQVVDRPRLLQASIPFDDRSNLYRPLQAAYEALAKVHATNKGILIVTDGYVEPGYDYAQLAMQLASGEVSVSCVAVGREANHELLREIARWGNGRYYPAEDVQEAARVLEREIQEFARAVVIERPIEVLAIRPGEVLNGVDIDLSPTLFGYVRVKPKLASETLLVTQKSKDPILVTWKYGAGRSAIFTSDVRGKWSQLWVSDWADQFARLWQNLVEWCTRAEPGIDYAPRIQVRGWELHCQVDALDARNKFVNNQPPRAGLYPLGEKGQVFSEASRIETPMIQTGPGRYEARPKVNRSGVYLFKAARPDGTAAATTGAVVSVSRELASLLPNLALRDQLCEITGGKVARSARDVFKLEGAAKKRPHDLGCAFLLAACFLFLLDVLARRWPAVTEFLSRRPVP
ncbi:MAG: VWA domain-containing protein [Planctomycetes bacterium]|nr:VWA domain-containing protein [Planctomycetota bacterium]